MNGLEHRCPGRRVNYTRQHPRWRLTLVLVVVAVIGGLESGWAEPSRIPFHTLIHDAAGGADLASPTIFVVRNERDVDRLFQYVPSPIIRNALETVAFSERVAIAVFLGRRATGGYAIEVKDIVAEGSVVRVRVTRGEPARGQIVHQAENVPYHVVLISRSAFPESRTTRWVMYSDQGKILAETTLPKE